MNRMAVGAIMMCALAGPALAAETKSEGDTTTLNDTDRAFINEAARGGLAEVEMGKLAEQKAATPDVKDFGRRMVRDHMKANRELVKLAEQKGVTPPTNLDPHEKAMYDNLAAMSGIEFDRAYMSGMVADHQKDVAAFEREATENGGNAELKRWVSRTLPVLRDHRKNAIIINDRLKRNEAAKR